MLYTVKEVSEILKTNVSYVHTLRKSGLLPFIKLGTYKVRHETLQEFLKILKTLCIHYGLILIDKLGIKEYSVITSSYNR